MRDAIKVQEAIICQNADCCSAIDRAVTKLIEFPIGIDLPSARLFIICYVPTVLREIVMSFLCERENLSHNKVLLAMNLCDAMPTLHI